MIILFPLSWVGNIRVMTMIFVEINHLLLLCKHNTMFHFLISAVIHTVFQKIFNYRYIFIPMRAWIVKSLRLNAMERWTLTKNLLVCPVITHAQKIARSAFSLLKQSLSQQLIMKLKLIHCDPQQNSLQQAKGNPRPCYCFQYCNFIYR